jgi:hypothetical protein
MAAPWQLEALSARIESLRAEITRVSEKDHPYHEPRIAFRALLNVIAHREKKFKEAVRFSTSPRSVHLAYETLTLDVENIWQVFSLVDRVDSSRIPFEILRAVAWVANDLLGGSHRIVVRLDPLYNYSLFSLQAKFAEYRWQEFWSSAVHNSAFQEKKFLLLGFPSAEADSILLHALMAHELGHALAHTLSADLSTDLLEADLQVRPTHSDELRELVNQIAEFRHRIASRGVTLGDVHNVTAQDWEAEIEKMLRSWSAEVFADCFAARLLGPAYLAALDRILIGESVVPTMSHPGAAFRRAIILENVTRCFPSLMADPVWNQLTDPTGSTRSDYPAAGFAEDVCSNFARKLDKYLDMIASPLAGPTKDLEALLSDMDEYIMNLAPLSAVLCQHPERCSPASFWLILFAAWRFRLNKRNFEQFAAKYGLGNDWAAAERILGNLVLHSLHAFELWVGRPPTTANEV